MTISKNTYESIIEMEEFHPLFGDGRGGIETLRFDAAQDLSLPTVTMPISSRRKPEPKRCHMARGLKLFCFLFPIYFYRQINDVSVSTDMFSSPIVRNDYSSVRSIHDLDSLRVAQLQRCNRRVFDCPCQNPLVPNPRDSQTEWQTKHATNVKMLKNPTLDTNRSVIPDVIFYGDGLVEGWSKYSSVFDSFFNMAKGGKFNAIALGIADDRSPNLLWRLKNDEMPDEYSDSSTEPAVIWLTIGSQDLGLTSCSPEMVIIGILRIVEEILLRTTTCHVVINGILPRTFNRDGYVNKGGLLNPSSIGIPTGMGTSGSGGNTASSVFNTAGSTDGTNVASTTKSLWQDIQVVNEELKLYARYRHRVSYFDHNKKLFKDPKATGKELRIDPKYMEDYFHLTQKGYQQWGAAISKRLEKLIVLPYRSTPEEFTPNKKKAEEEEVDFFYGEDDP